MRVLALDTTTREGSVAFVVDDRVVDERRGDSTRTHAERLPRELLDVADAQGLSLADIDLYAVASGPGSFTGLRIGIATMQGLAFATGRPMAAVSALEALGAMGSLDASAGALVAAWMDARRSDVFATLYRVGAAPIYSAERLTVVEGPTVGSPASTLTRWRVLANGVPVTFVGDGAVRYADAIEQSRLSLRPPPTTPALAGAIGRLAIASVRREGARSPAAVQPLYVRRPDAEIERDRHHQTAK